MSFHFKEQINGGDNYNTNLDKVQKYLDRAECPVIAFIDSRGIRSSAIRSVTNAHGRDGLSHVAIYVGNENGKCEFAEAVSTAPFGFFAKKGKKNSGYIKIKPIEDIFRCAKKVLLYKVNLNGKPVEDPNKKIREYVERIEGDFNRFDNMNLFTHYFLNNLLFPISVPYRLITGGRDLIPQMRREKKKSCPSLCIDAVNDVTGIDITPDDKRRSFVTPQKLSESRHLERIGKIYFD